MKKRALWALGILGIVLVMTVILSTLINGLGSNYMNPDKKINWVDVCWGVAGALVAYFSFTEISKLDQHPGKSPVKRKLS
ncbi:MAG TPA: hypothetical protein VG964_00525 [Candidatus Saccharimonadales bacterium]|nr:hypothetical protein [Candidatus Saccharimonadales bacterium]